MTSGVVYIGSYDGKVYAIDAISGRERWIRRLSGKPILGSPVVSAGTVYIGSTDAKIYALDAETGVILWAYTTGNQITRGPAVADGLVYIGSNDGSLYAFSTARNPGSEPTAPTAGAASSPRQASGIIPSRGATHPFGQKL